MKLNKYVALTVFAAMTMTFTSCKEEDRPAGNPELSVITPITSACFGDKLHFEVKCSDSEVPLSTVKATLYFGDEQVAQTVIRTKESGVVYEGDIVVPYLANIPDGKATLTYTLQNINFTIKEVSSEVLITHVDYPYVTLVSSDEANPAEYRLDRVGNYTYELTSSLPQKIKGFIRTPVTDRQKEGLLFGQEKNEVVIDGSAAMVFSNPTAGVYTISFNSFNFEHAPNLAFKFDGEEMVGYDENSAMVDLTLSKDQMVRVDIPEFDQWWIDPDYFVSNGDGTLTFLPNGGSYRVMAYVNHKYLRVYKISGDQPAAMNATGLGALWLTGVGVGKPSYSANPVNWVADNSLCFASNQSKVYEMTFVAGSTIATTGVEMKLAGKMDGGDAFTSANIKTVDSTLIGLGDGKNGHADGVLYLLDGVTLNDGATYSLKVDVTKGKKNVVVTFAEVK